MNEKETVNGGILADITEHLAGIFRHMLPGVLVIGGTNLAYPEWFGNINFDSWPQLVILTVVTITAGNTWFALNRYGLHQLIDYLLYLIKYKGPIMQSKKYNYLNDLGEYTNKSLHLGEKDRRAQQHVAFRASIVLLIFTLGELAVLFGFCHSTQSKLENNSTYLISIGIAVIAIGIWQMIITRSIDYCIVNPENIDTKPNH